jgi:peptidoglycan/xylan/chitin deacetylase (PgdA/CDA1 family)
LRIVVRHALAPVNAAAARALGIPRTLGPGTDQAVAVTFDDGPHPEGTPAVLEVLARARARATFFVIGEQVERRPELARRILAEGHGVALHGYRHRLQLRRRAGELEDDLARGVAAIEDACGVTPRHHRPPYGIYSPSGLRVTRAHGLEPVLWSAWGKDWRKFTTPQRIAARVLADAHPGGVILLHDADFYSARGSHERTAPALERILTELGGRGIGTVLLV